MTTSAPSGHAVRDQMAIGLLESENQTLRLRLQEARHKLTLYREAHGGAYLGGVEYSELMRRIDAALSK